MSKIEICPKFLAVIWRIGMGLLIGMAVGVLAGVIVTIFTDSYIGSLGGLLFGLMTAFAISIVLLTDFSHGDY